MAVLKDIVGKDKDGELIWADGELRRDCCCAAAAARRAAVAVWTSAFDLGEVEKKFVNFFTLGDDDALRGSSNFSLYVVGVGAVEGVLLAKGFNGLRDIMGQDWRASAMRF